MLPLPTISSVISSSSADVASFSTYLLPLVYLSFAVVAVVAIFGLVINLFHWIGIKITNFVDVGQDVDIIRARRAEAEFDAIQRRH